MILLLVIPIIVYSSDTLKTYDLNGQPYIAIADFCNINYCSGLEYNRATSEVVFFLGSANIRISNNSTSVFINDTKIIMPFPAVISSNTNRMMIPQVAVSLIEEKANNTKRTELVSSRNNEPRTEFKVHGNYSNPNIPSNTTSSEVYYKPFIVDIINPTWLFCLSQNEYVAKQMGLDGMLLGYAKKLNYDPKTCKYLSTNEAKEKMPFGSDKSVIESSILSHVHCSIKLYAFIEMEKVLYRAFNQSVIKDDNTGYTIKAAMKYNNEAYTSQIFSCKTEYIPYVSPSEITDGKKNKGRRKKISRIIRYPTDKGKNIIKIISIAGKDKLKEQTKISLDADLKEEDDNKEEYRSANGDLAVILEGPIDVTGTELSEKRREEQKKQFEKQADVCATTLFEGKGTLPTLESNSDTTTLYNMIDLIYQNAFCDASNDFSWALIHHGINVNVRPE